jgi:hypothetical protein
MSGNPKRRGRAVPNGVLGPVLLRPWSKVQGSMSCHLLHRSAATELSARLLAESLGDTSDRRIDTAPGAARKIRVQRRELKRKIDATSF